MFKHPFCVYRHNTHHFHIKKKTFRHLNEALRPIYPFSTSNHFTFIVSFSIFLYSFISASFSDVSIATLSARAMERLNTLNGDSFQPFRGLSELWHSKCFCFFFVSSPFSLVPFFPARHQHMCVVSLSLWSSKFICLPLIATSHCHNTKLLTVDRECLFNHDSYSSSSSSSSL